MDIGSRWTSYAMLGYWKRPLELLAARPACRSGQRYYGATCGGSKGSLPFWFPGSGHCLSPAGSVATAYAQYRLLRHQRHLDEELLQNAVLLGILELQGHMESADVRM